MNRVSLGLLLLSAVLTISTQMRSIGFQNFGIQEFEDEWSQPIDLARNREGKSLFPTLLADDSGGLHLFWDEFKEVPGGSEVMVIYAYWDGKTWSEPIDIFIGTRGQLAYGVSVDVDDLGYLHTLWIDEIGLMYGKRHVSTPIAAGSWNNRQRIIAESGGTVVMPVLKIDDEGGLHAVVLIRGSQPGIYYLSSADGGETWQSPIPISDPSVTEWRRGMIRNQLDLLLRGEEVHVAWQGVDQFGTGSVFYTRGTESGQEWSDPIAVQEAGSWPKLSHVSSGELLLSSVGSDEDGRICMKRQSISKDMGETWSPTEILFDPVKGCLANSHTIPDGDGIPHQVMSAYDSTPIVERIWHTVWSKDSWDYPEEINWSGISYHDRDLGNQPDNPRMAITNGNQLHVVFNTDEGRIWYTSKLLDASSQPQTLYPTPEIEYTQQSTAIDPLGNARDRVQPTIEPQSNDLVNTPEFSKASDTEAIPLDPALAGLVAVLLLLAAAVLVTQRRRRDKHSST